MQLAANQLAGHLQRGVKSLYTLHGDEGLLQQEALDAIRSSKFEGKPVKARLKTESAAKAFFQ